MRMVYCPVRMDYQVVFSVNYFVSKDYNSVSKECTFMRMGLSCRAIRILFCTLSLVFRTLFILLIELEL